MILKVVMKVILNKFEYKKYIASENKLMYLWDCGILKNLLITGVVPTVILVISNLMVDYQIILIPLIYIITVAILVLLMLAFIDKFKSETKIENNNKELKGKETPIKEDVSLRKNSKVNSNDEIGTKEPIVLKSGFGQRKDIEEDLLLLAENYAYALTYWSDSVYSLVESVSKNSNINNKSKDLIINALYKGKKEAKEDIVNSNEEIIKEIQQNILSGKSNNYLSSNKELNILYKRLESDIKLYNSFWQKEGFGVST